MLVATSEHLKGREIIETFGLVIGSTTRAQLVTEEAVSNIRKFIGGEAVEYTDGLALAREEAVQRMIKEAEELKANAIVGMRFSITSVTPNVVEIVAYGTAVNVKESE